MCPLHIGDFLSKDELRIPTAQTLRYFFGSSEQVSNTAQVPMTDPYVCHIWFAIYHQNTPVLLASIYHTWILGGEGIQSYETKYHSIIVSRDDCCDTQENIIRCLHQTPALDGGTDRNSI